MHGTAKTTTALGAALLLSVCPGCEKQTDTGRIDVYETREADLKSDRALRPAMYEFSDEVVEKLLQDLADIPEIEDAPTRAVLYLGSLANHTNTPRSDFEMLQTRIRTNLLRSRDARDRFIFQEDRGRTEADYQRVQGNTQGDLLQEGGNTGGAATYDDNIVFVLTGDFYETRRHGSQTFYFEFKLARLDGRLVWAENYDLGQEKAR